MTKVTSNLIDFESTCSSFLSFVSSFKVILLLFLESAKSMISEIVACVESAKSVIGETVACVFTSEAHKHIIFPCHPR